MTEDKYNIEVAVNAQLEELTKVQGAVDELNQKVKEFSEQASNVDRIWSGAMYNIGEQISNLALKFPSLATATIQAFGQQEAVLQRLSAAVRSSGGNVSEVLPIMRQFASDIQAITTYGDEQVHSMMAMATSMGVTAGQMDGVMRSAIGLSTALGMDVTTATKAAAAAVQGKTTMLQEYIPSLVKCKTEEEKLAQVQQLSASGFAQAEAAANTLDGKLKQAANAWGDLQEVMGEAFAPAAKAVAGLVKGICSVMAENATITKVLTTALASCAVGFAFANVGGLMNVAKMFFGVATATKTAAGAMHTFSLAIKANPIGLIASAAAASVLGLAQLADYVANLESEEEKEAAAQEAANEARRKAAEDARAASAVLEEYAEAVAREGESADDTAERIEALSAEIEKLSDRSKWGENDQEAAAQKVVEKKKELVELQNKYLEQVKSAAAEEYRYDSNRETERKYRVEQELNAARKTGIAHIINFKEAELAHVEELLKSVEIQKRYYADHEHLVSSEEDRKRIMADAAAYADEQLQKMREESGEAEWLNGEVERSKAVQRGLEMDILRARASGDEAGARELEGRLRIAQLSAEIFENTRKEGMSRRELEALQQSANEKAREKYDLEKSVTDEVERQNLAKNAQAKIEDILLTNKIEQLKAEGKLTEARELEREREIKRTLAGMKGLSEADKESIAATMRQTNDYRDRQEQMRGSPGGGGFGAGGSAPSSGSGGFSGGSTGFKTPATVSKKSAGFYAEWKAAGGSKSGENWTDYRMRRAGEVEAQGKARKSYESARRFDASTPVSEKRARAGNTLQGIAEQSEAIGGRVGLPKPGGALAATSAASRQTAQFGMEGPSAVGPQGPQAAAPAPSQDSRIVSLLSDISKQLGGGKDGKNGGGGAKDAKAPPDYSPLLNKISEGVQTLIEKQSKQPSV